VSVADRFQVMFGETPQAAAAEFYERFTSLEVEENADLPGAFQLTLPIATEGAAGSEDLTLVGDERWKPYARVAVVITPDGGADDCIFDGYVLSHRLHLDRGTTAASLRIWGQDMSCKMNVKEEVKAWNKKDDAIANDLFGKYHFTAAQANSDADASDHPDDGQVLIQRATDAQFLRDRARRTGKLFRVACGAAAGQNTGYFCKPDLDARPDLTLTLNPPAAATVDAIDIEWDVARPTSALAQVLLASKDPETGDAAESGLSLLDRRSLAAFIGGDEFKMEARLTAAADTVGELHQRTASLLREAGWFVRCEGEADLARLRKVMRAARVVEVAGAGRVHSGKYFVWSVRHTITAEAHRMRFVLVRNAVGAS
jgi:hypothetical protein